MIGFDTFVVVDWSARAKPSPATPSADAIWIAVSRGADIDPSYHRTRAAAMDFLTDLFQTERSAGRRVLAGFDFPFGYPRGFAKAVTGKADPLALWDWLATRIKDADDNVNNRFKVARHLNTLFPGIGPFWGCPAKEADDILPAKGTLRTDHGLPERREVETAIRQAQPCWKLFTTGSVGSQALLGLPRLQQLRAVFGDDLAVAPFQAPDAPIVLAEVFPSLLAPQIAAEQGSDEIKDRAQVRILARALSRLNPADLDRLLRKGDPEEGWILGVGEVPLLIAALAQPLAPPFLRNDCFALPAGVDWVPVDDALQHLRRAITPVVGSQTVALNAACGRVLAQDIAAIRANPPHPNTAVDGYGFAGGRPTGAHVLPLVSDRATAGATPPPVPNGMAIRVLTGAALPQGVDTVVLQEDVSTDENQIAFHGPIKPGANTRRAGEDVQSGDVILSAGRMLSPADLALAAATGHGSLPVRNSLRVGVLSTGDELREAGAPPEAGQIYDANRPMLLSLLQKFGVTAVDLGRVPDDRTGLRDRLDAAAGDCDAVLTSGGASAGDEDHVSALLTEAGAMQMWRIAVKPGRPLALGMWQGLPVFGLPGNPVAALVCTLIFARPALGVLAGRGWIDPQAFDMPAGFDKTKKPGRREFLRARIQSGKVQIFKSEGSGRISGLSWADGLVELPDEAVTVTKGDLVRYIPFSSFWV